MRATALIAVLLALVAAVYSWTDIGHIMVAEIGRRGISKEQSDGLNAMLSTYSDYFKDTDVIRIPYAATFMDYIKRDTNVFDAMHYIDYPYILDGEITPPTLDTTNALAALKFAGESLIFSKGAGANVWSKSFSLLLMLHVLGDMHQPLHAVTMYSKALNLEKGDMGGNQYKIQYVGPDGTHYKQVHLLYDCIGGIACEYMPTPVTAEFQDKITVMTDELMRDFPKEALVAEGYVLEPNFADAADYGKFIEAWTKESYEMSKEVYNIIPFNKVFDQEADKELLNTIISTLRKRIAIAGYRTANILKRINTSINGYTPQSVTKEVIIEQKGKTVSNTWKIATIVCVILLSISLVFSAIFFRKYLENRNKNDLVHGGQFSQLQ